MDLVDQPAAILALATAFRAAILETDAALLPLPMRSFPNGACGITCDLLAEYLKEHGLDAFEVVSARLPETEPFARQSHAWLEGYGLIVDATGDQFAELGDEIIVARQSPWHERLLDAERRKPGIGEYANAAEIWAGYFTIRSVATDRGFES